MSKSYCFISFRTITIVDVLDLNQMICHLIDSDHICAFKRTNFILGFGSQAILYRANFFERTPFVPGGGYRSRTDDPLLAKQVL